MQHSRAHTIYRGNRGYIALMATIIISLVLLVMIINEGFAGWMTRFTVLGTEAKEQANALAEGCADQALASLITDPNYLGNTTSNTPGGDCKVFSISPADLQAGLVTIKTQAVVRDAFANLELLQSVNNIHLGAIPTAPTYGTLIVQTVVSSGSSAQPSDFAALVSGPSGISPASFAGSSAGVIVHIPTPTSAPTSNYSVAQSPVPGYVGSMSADCAGAIKGGDIKSCTITNAPVTTTLTLIANVSNNDGTGTLTPSDIPLYIDGVAATLGHAYTVAAGTHTASATVPAGYLAGAWGYQCASSGSASLNLGDNKICIINLDDIPPPAPVCADTVMMLDRSGSMFDNSAWIPDEKTAAKALVDLYAGVTSSHPLLGMGRFGDASRISAEIISTLQNTYASIKTAIDNSLTDNNSSTNLADAISKGSDELNSSRHDPAKQKVLILISDGSPNQPSGSVSGNQTLVPSASSATTTLDQWSAQGGSKAAAMASDDDDTSYITPSVSGQSYQFANAGIPAAATNISVTFHAFAKRGSASAASIALLAENSSSQSVGASQAVTSQTTYNDYTWTLASNPLTGNAWTAAEVNAWTTRFGIINTSASGGIPRVTQMYVTASYQLTGSVGPKFPGTASASNGIDRWNNSTKAFLNDGQYTTAAIDGYRQRFINFGFAVPSGASVTGIEVSVEAKSSDPTGCELDVDLAPDNNNFGNNKTISLGASDAVTTLGGPADTWSDSWTQAEVNSSNFAVRFEDVDPGSQCSSNSTVSVDYLQAKIYYATGGTSAALAPVAFGPSAAWAANTGTQLSAILGNDGDATYVSSQSAGSSAQQLFFFPGATIPLTASNISVEVHAQAKEVNGSSGAIRFVAERGGALQTSSSQPLGGSYSDEEWDLNTNPFGGNWSVSDVNNWGMRFGVENASSVGSSARVSQIEVVIRYSIVTTPTAAALAAADAAKISNTNIFTIYFGSGNPTLLAQLASGSTPNGTHQSGSYNDPNGVVNGDSGWLSPSGNAADTGGDNNGFESNPTRAYADDNQAAQNIDGAGDRHRYFGYNTSLPPGAVVTGIEVRPNWWLDSTTGTNSLGIELSYDAGAHWTAAKTDTNESTSNSHTATLGSQSDTWGHVWSASELSATNFRVRVTMNSTVSTRDFSLDHLPVRITYSVNNENGDGDNFFIAPTSADMKGIFEFIGSQICPAINNVGAASAPTTGSLLVLTRSNDASAISVPVSIAAQNPSNAGYTATGITDSMPNQTTIIVDPGTYSVTQGAVAGYTQSRTDSCSSSLSTPIAAGETRTCVLTNTKIPPPPAPPNLTITPGSWQEVPDTHP